MQAILTKYIPATNVNSTRIKAKCARGSLTVSVTYCELQLKPNEQATEENVHRVAVRSLLQKFISEDVKKYGSKTHSPWDWDFVTGTLPNGDYCHILLEE